MVIFHDQLRYKLIHSRNLLHLLLNKPSSKTLNIQSTWMIWLNNLLDVSTLLFKVQLDFDWLFGHNFIKVVESHVDCRGYRRNCCFTYSCSNWGRYVFSYIFILRTDLIVPPHFILVFLTTQVVKQRMQTGQFTSASHAVRLITSKEGFKGLYAVWDALTFPSLLP